MEHSFGALAPYDAQTASGVVRWSCNAFRAMLGASDPAGSLLVDTLLFGGM